MRRLLILLLFFIVIAADCGGREAWFDRQPEFTVTGPLQIADPFVYRHGACYYAYGTQKSDGIVVYRSKDLVHWDGPCGNATAGLALHKSDSWGDKKFWAPEVYAVAGRYVMTYSVDEHTAVAFADTPLGPFRQDEPMDVYLPEYKNIDSHIFIDDDGQAYIYFVRFDLGNGNEIRSAKLSADLKTIVSEQTACIRVIPGTWEKVPGGGSVAEGPFVLKHNGIYYLTYSCNDFRSQDYAVGYATSANPEGPWTRYEGNPILHRYRGYYGTGHHSFLTTPGGMYIVYHAHKDATASSPRKMLIAPISFVAQPCGPDKLVVGNEVIVPLLVEYEPE